MKTAIILKILNYIKCVILETKIINTQNSLILIFFTIIYTFEVMSIVYVQWSYYIMMCTVLFPTQHSVISCWHHGIGDAESNKPFIAQKFSTVTNQG